MNVTMLKAKAKDPSFNQGRIRHQKPTHQYVIPSNFATIPNNPVQSRIMRNAHNRRRISLPPSIREEEEEEEDDEENIPLAILAYRKGFITPDSLPLVQDLQRKRYTDPCFQMMQNHQFYQLYNSSFSSSSSSSLSSNELFTKRHVPATEPKFYRRYSSGK